MWRAWGIVLLVASLVLPVYSSASPRWGEDELRWAKNIEKSKGKIQWILARSQARSAVREEEARPLLSLFEAFGGSLGKGDAALARKLHASLRDLVESTKRGEPIVRSAQRTLLLLDRALPVLISPSLRAEPRFQAALIGLLLLDAAEEYEEWLREGERGDYGEGWGNLQRARHYWQTLLPTVRARFRKTAGEVQSGLATFAQFFRSPLPPPREQAPSGDTLEEAAEDVLSALQEAFGPLISRPSPAEHVRIAIGYLERARSAYRAGERGLALEFLFAAYVDHYAESASETLKAVVPELERRVTALLRQVRSRMRAAAPAAEAEGLIGQALTVLRKAQARLVGR